MQNYVTFNKIAFFYDRLCQFVFGQSVKNSQIEALRFISPKSKILIIGGGTGWILEEITKIHPSQLEITYVDISSKMIQLSKRRKSGLNKVHFINKPIQETNLLDKEYDIILTPFLFDMFSQSTVQLIFDKVNNSLKIDGLWLYADFYLSKKSKYWQFIIIKLMYFFFRLTCSIEANELPFLTTSFSSLKKIHEKKYCSNFIIMQVLQKQF